MDKEIETKKPTIVWITLAFLQTVFDLCLRLIEEPDLMFPRPIVQDDLTIKYGWR